MTARTRRLLAMALALGALAIVLTACTATANMLTGKTWQLSAITEKVPAFQGVVPADQQANYTITFNTDGNVAIKADCNQAAGTYTTSDGGGLTITLGPTTLVACPEGSLSDQYLAALAKAEIYAVDGSNLTITLTDEGTLEFVAAQ